MKEINQNESPESSKGKTSPNVNRNKFFISKSKAGERTVNE